MLVASKLFNSCYIDSMDFRHDSHGYSWWCMIIFSQSWGQPLEKYFIAFFNTQIQLYRFYYQRQMNTKLDAILNLKHKLLEMQRGLEKLATKEDSINCDKSLFTKTLNFDQNRMLKDESLNYQTFRSPAKEKKKNPTFWGDNPIVGKENGQKPPDKWKKSPARHRKVNLSPKLAGLMQNIDSNYYHEQKAQKEDSAKLYQTNPVKLPQRYEYRFHGMQRDTPRFERIRTYEKQERDPILNPQPPRYAGKKIVKKPVMSPKNAFTENPTSDPLVYFFKGKKTSLSPKLRLQNRKNLSPNMKDVLNRSLEEPVASPPRRQSRKHFQQYFKDTFEGSWH